MKKNQDLLRGKRIAAKRFSWIEYVALLFVFSILSAVPGLTLGNKEGLDTILRFAPVYFLYWAVIAAIFCGITAVWRYRTFDKPLRIFSEATRKVANGDFSVFIEPVHRPDQYDYIDLMYVNFNKMVAELGSIETLKNDFTSNVSHEMKTPLAVIRNYTNALQKEGLSTEDRAEYIQTIVGATDKLTGLIANILKLTKLENQEIVPQQQPYDLCRQLSDCVISCEKQWEKKDIEMEVDIEDRATITADASMMEIVWNNLLSNAIKFTEPGGKITLRQTSDEHAIIVSVTDTGCGMDKETTRRIFDKFYQGDTSHSTEGNGLGLALVRRVIDQIGATLTVVSEPGKGSTFTVKIDV